MYGLAMKVAGLGWSPAITSRSQHGRRAVKVAQLFITARLKNLNTPEKETDANQHNNINIGV
jgi:hypothetical protein